MNRTVTGLERAIYESPGTEVLGMTSLAIICQSRESNDSLIENFYGDGGFVEG